MNQTSDTLSGSWHPTSSAAQSSRDIQAPAPSVRAARAFVRALDQACLDLPADVERRLAFARQAALDHARMRVCPNLTLSPTMPWRIDLQGLLELLRSWTYLLPALALLAGLLTTSHVTERRNVAAAAAIDAALLNDELPPEAYTDPGFVAFLRSGQSVASQEATSADRPTLAAPAE